MTCRQGWVFLTCRATAYKRYITLSIYIIQYLSLTLTIYHRVGIILTTLGVEVMALDEYLNLKEAARYLGVSDIKIRRLVSKGLLKVSFDPLDDRKRLVKKTDLDTLKTPRPVESATAQYQGDKSRNLALGKKSTSNTKKGNASDES